MDDAELRHEIDQLIRSAAGGDEFEYWRLWKKLGTWSMDRTQGDVTKKSTLKKRLVAELGALCENCGQSFEPAALDMHRIDSSYAHQRARDFGYFAENVRLLCRPCHGRER